MKKSKLSRRRNRIKGTAKRPRLVVFRSNKHIYAQVIDDDLSHTLLSCSTLDSELKGKTTDLTNVQISQLVGEALGKKLLDKEISKALSNSFFSIIDIGSFSIRLVVYDSLSIASRTLFNEFSNN